MARSRRSYRRSTSQRAVSLLASALPAPIARVADTQFGSTLLLFGIPALIVAGILHLNWEGGLPHLSIDRNRAASIQQAAHDELGRINSDTLQQLHHSAHEVWDATIGHGQIPYGQSPYAQGSNYQPTPIQANNQYGGAASSQQLSIPSSSAARYVSSQASPQGYSTSNSFSNPSSYQQPTSSYQQPVPQPYYYQQSQPQFNPQSQQPAYQTPNYQPSSYQQPSYYQPQPQQYYQQSNNGQTRY